MGVYAPGEEPLLSQKKATDWSTQHETLGFFLDTNDLTISLSLRKSKELKDKLAHWAWSRKTPTVKEFLVLSGKLHYSALVVRPGRYFVRRLLQLCRLHLNENEVRRRGEA